MKVIRKFLAIGIALLLLLFWAAPAALAAEGEPIVEAANYFKAIGTASTTNGHYTVRGLIVKEDGAAHMIVEFDNENIKDIVSVEIQLFDGSDTRTISLDTAHTVQAVRSRSLTVRLSDGAAPVTLSAGDGHKGMFLLVPLGEIGDLSEFFVLSMLSPQNGWSIVGMKVNVDLGYTIEKTADREAVYEGACVTYTVTVKNSGAVRLSQVRVVDDLPAGFTPLSVNGAAPRWADGRLLLAEDATLAVGETVSYEVPVRVDTVPAEGVYQNTAAIRSPALMEKQASADVRVTYPRFSVYHQSSGETETIRLRDLPEGPFDITRPIEGVYGGVSAGHLYGGIYTGADFVTPITDECGKTLAPRPDTTYYLKEVPDTYLRPAAMNVWAPTEDRTGVETKAMYFLTTVDDQNYIRVGFDYGAPGAPAEKAGEVPLLCEKIRYYEADTLKATFGVNSVSRNTSGYIACYNFCDTADIRRFEISYIPYFVTPDGVKVTGVRERSLTVPSADPARPDDFDHADTVVSSVTSLYAAPGSGAGTAFVPLSLQPSCEMGRAEADNGFLPGDADQSGVVDTTDARLTLQYAAGKRSGEGMDLSAMDVTGGGITTTSARLILQYAAGKIPGFDGTGTKGA